MNKITRQIVRIVIFGTIGLAMPCLARDLSGTGEWRSLTGDAIWGTWKISMAETAGSLTGTMTVTGSNVFSGGTIVGSIDGSSIMLGVMNDDVKVISFSGKLNGNSASGEWQSDTVSDNGTWEGILGAAAR